MQAPSPKTNTESYLSRGQSIKGLITYPFMRFVDAVLPPRCPVTGHIVDRQAVLSPEAWSQMRFLSSPQCHCCGLPFEFEQESTDNSGARTSDGKDVTEDEKNLCLDCLRYTKSFDTSRAPLGYGDASRKIILSFKYGDQLHCADLMAGLMTRCINENIEYAVIIPVPLHRTRLLKRRFNQSGILAQRLSKRLNISYNPHILDRVRATPPQKDKNNKQRRKNVRSAFAVPDLHALEVKNKNILLIDDVFTTGATVDECAKALKNQGAKRVDVLTFARTVRD